MTLNVQLTEPDFRQANSAVRAQKLMTISTLPVFYVFLAYSIGTILGNLFQPLPPGSSPRGVFDVIISSFPLILLSIYWGVVNLRMRGRKAHGFIIPPPPLTSLGVTIPTLLCATMFVITVSCIVLAPILPEPPSAGPAPRVAAGKALAALVLPYVPLVAMLMASIWMVLRLNSGNISRAFELQVNLQRPRTIKIEPETLTVSDETHQTQYAWAAFIGWHETDHLVLLYRSFISFEIIPKRSFESFQALQEFLDLARVKIGEQRRGFDLVQNPPALPGASSFQRTEPPPLPRASEK